MGQVIHTLIVEDNDHDAMDIVRALKHGGIQPKYSIIDNPASFERILKNEPWDIILSDFVMDQFNGLQALQIVTNMQLDIPFIIVSDMIAEKTIVQAMLNGASDCIMKDKIAKLVPAVKREIKEANTRKSKNQIEHALHESEKRFEAIFEQAAVGVALIESQTGHYVRINRRYCEIVGYHRNELLQMNFQSLTHPDDLTLNLEHLNLLIEGKHREFSMEKRCFRKNKELAWIHLSITPLWKNHEPANYFIEVIDDITDKKTVQLERESLLKTLKNKNEELESIIYVSSHDLRTPLLNIQGHSGELKKCLSQVKSTIKANDKIDDVFGKIDTLIENDIENCLNFITRNTTKIHSLINGLLYLCRLGQMELNIHRIDVNLLINDVLNSQNETLKKTSALLKVRKLPPCLGDRRLLFQVFANLIDNAIVFRHPDRQLSITIDGTVRSGHMVYSCSDNGIGLDMQYQHKIFEIFHRLDPEKESGRQGLGLTITKRILDRLNGRIWLNSEPDKGSTFFVTLPC